MRNKRVGRGGRQGTKKTSLHLSSLPVLRVSKFIHLSILSVHCKAWADTPSPQSQREEHSWQVGGVVCPSEDPGTVCTAVQGPEESTEAQDVLHLESPKSRR